MSHRSHKIMAAIQRRLADRVPDQARLSAGQAAAVSLVLAPDGDHLEMLFIKRAERAGDPWSGQMALPGGRREDADDSLLDTARRETNEETGLVLREEDCLGVLDDLRPQTPTLPPVTVRPYVFGLEEARPPVTLNPEATLHLWVPLPVLRASRGRARVAVRGRHLDVDAFLIGPNVVWGMTHRIIMPFLDLVNND